MTTLTVRRLRIDLEAPFAADWLGNAFVSAWFNALSMSFPVGEQFFIDAVRAGAAQLPEAERARFEAEVRGFIGQEATHRRVHSLFNGQLERNGLVNTWEPRAARRIARMRGLNVRHHLAVTAALEHLTAILAEHLLGHGDVLGAAELRLRTMWLWHAAEESEHRSTAFELYRALGGDEPRRRFWMRLVTFHFITDALRQTVRNLHRSGQLWQRSTWSGAWQFLFGRERGLWPHLRAPWRAYFRADFHPRQLGGSLGEDWLAAHGDIAEPVGRASAQPA